MIQKSINKTSSQQQKLKNPPCCGNITFNITNPAPSLNTTNNATNNTNNNTNNANLTGPKNTTNTTQPAVLNSTNNTVNKTKPVYVDEIVPPV